ncbi:MAG: hypothetical protein JW818_19370 [Pirellulales bacterium]|nr:hypothetical protein [Pirellulales bacterium]
MLSRIRYNTIRPGEKRKHYLCQEDIEVLLGRLPEETYQRLRAVHFNDLALGRRVIGYVNRGRREIALCALPPQVSLSACFVRRSARGAMRVSPEQFGAVRGMQWPETAVRRFMLYDVFLHELGHLQVVDADVKDPRRRFAGETLAQEFANRWRTELWSQPFYHTDPIHRRAKENEVQEMKQLVHTRMKSNCPDR